MSPLSATNVTIVDLDAHGFRRLAHERLLAAPPTLSEPQSAGDDDLNPGLNRDGPSPCPAAVLVPVVARSPLSIILTERTGHLSNHAGQIAFPGGKVEAGDAGPLATALREAREEIALDAEFIEPLGFLPPYRTSTGFIITPAVALVRPGFKLAAEPTEVADIFEVPLAFLMDESNHTIDSRIWHGAERHFYAMPYAGRYIWGATAGIIRMLYRRFFSA